MLTPTRLRRDDRWAASVQPEATVQPSQRPARRWRATALCSRAGGGKNLGRVDGKLGAFFGATKWEAEAGRDAAVVDFLHAPKRRRKEVSARVGPEEGPDESGTIRPQVFGAPTPEPAPSGAAPIPIRSADQPPQAPRPKRASTVVSYNELGPQGFADACGRAGPGRAHVNERRASSVAELIPAPPDTIIDEPCHVQARDECEERLAEAFESGEGDAASAHRAPATAVWLRLRGAPLLDLPHGPASLTLWYLSGTRRACSTRPWTARLVRALDIPPSHLSSGGARVASLMGVHEALVARVDGAAIEFEGLHPLHVERRGVVAAECDEFAIGVEASGFASRQAYDDAFAAAGRGVLNLACARRGWREQVTCALIDATCGTDGECMYHLRELRVETLTLSRHSCSRGGVQVGERSFSVPASSEAFGFGNRPTVGASPEVVEEAIATSRSGRRIRKRDRFGAESTICARMGPAAGADPYDSDASDSDPPMRHLRLRLLPEPPPVPEATIVGDDEEAGASPVCSTHEVSGLRVSERVRAAASLDAAAARAFRDP